EESHARGGGNVSSLRNYFRDFCGRGISNAGGLGGRTPWVQFGAKSSRGKRRSAGGIGADRGRSLAGPGLGRAAVRAFVGRAQSSAATFQHPVLSGGRNDRARGPGGLDDFPAGFGCWRSE